MNLSYVKKSRCSAQWVISGPIKFENPWLNLAWIFFFFFLLSEAGPLPLWWRVPCQTLPEHCRSAHLAPEPTLPPLNLSTANRLWARHPRGRPTSPRGRPPRALPNAAVVPPRPQRRLSGRSHCGALRATRLAESGKEEAAVAAAAAVPRPLPNAAWETTTAPCPNSSSIWKGVSANNFTPH